MNSPVLRLNTWRKYHTDVPGASEVAVLEPERHGGAGGECGGSQRGRQADRGGAGGATAAGRCGHGGRAPPYLEAAQTVGIGITFSVDGEWATAL